MVSRNNLSIEDFCTTLNQFPEFVRANLSTNPPSRGREKRDVYIGDVRVLFYADSEGTVEDICVRGKGAYSFTGNPVWQKVAEGVAAEHKVIFGQSRFYSNANDSNCYFVSPRTKIDKSSCPEESSGLRAGADLAEEILRVAAAQHKFNRIIFAEVSRLIHFA